ncbi:MAG: protein-disulfide reductase DsbD [Ignavibacteria bacterium]|nr:protein-disulfide reductase DsbD [Ignavibacteria bacterium]
MKNLIIIIFTFLLTVPVFSQESEHLSYKTYTDKESYSAKDTVKIALKVKIKDKYHINSVSPTDESFIKTEVTAKSEDFAVLNTYFPPHKMYKFAFSETEIPVYEGEITVGLTLLASKELKNGSYTIPVDLSYQACDNAACYPPKSVKSEVTITLSETGKSSSKDVFEKIDFSKTVSKKEVKKNEQIKENQRPGTPNADEEKVSNFIEEKGMLLGILIIFVWGLALNLTPCIYPLIPITISYFGAQSSGNKFQSILMGVFYALGMAVTYSLMGLFAALTGSMLGTALQNPIVVIFIALIFIALATSMFGLWEIRVPQKLALAGNKNRSGYFGSLMMGLLVGFIAAPCIGPIVLSLLVYVGKLGNPLMGFFLFFVLSLGLGVPYIFLAAFSSSINKLPRSGEWMISVKLIFGFVLVIMAINTLAPLIPEDIYNILFPLSIIFAGLYLIIFDNKGLNSKGYTKVKYLIAIIGIIFGTWLLKPESHAAEISFKNLNSLEQIESSVKSESKPVIIDFYADWCAQCKELDKYTYTDEKVVELSKNINNIKIDLTKENPFITEKYGIKGLPVVIFMRANGEEIKELRVTGFMEPEEFSIRMKKLLDAK